MTPVARGIEWIRHVLMDTSVAVMIWAGIVFMVALKEWNMVRRRFAAAASEWIRGAAREGNDNRDRAAGADE